MKPFLTILGLMWALVVQIGANELEKNFAAPPDSAKPHVWWHWMEGSVTKAGITADLEAMQRVGLGGASADLGVGASAESAGQLASDVELDVGIADEQRLGIGVNGDELDAFEAAVDHAIDGIASATTHPDDLDWDVSQRKRALAGEIDTYQWEKRYLHKSGRIVWGFLHIL